MVLRYIKTVALRIDRGSVKVVAKQDKHINVIYFLFVNLKKKTL